MKAGPKLEFAAYAALEPLWLIYDQLGGFLINNPLVGISLL